MVTKSEKDFIESVMSPIEGGGQPLRANDTIPLRTKPKVEPAPEPSSDSGNSIGGGPRREHELDVRGLPMPIAYLRLRRALDKLASNAQLLAASSDAESLKGFPALARLFGHQVIEQHVVDRDFLFVFRRR